MRKFSELYARASERQGDAVSLEAKIPQTLSVEALLSIPDDRWLSQICKSVFQAGFVWRVVEQKWPAFEKILHGFDPLALAYLSDDDLDRLLRDQRLIRHHQKMSAVRSNAQYLTELAAAHGSAAAFFASWADADYVELLLTLKQHGTRLGGMSAQYVLRRMGKNAFVLSDDVVRVLISEGVVSKRPTSKRDLRAVQSAFNLWSRESGRGLTAISRVLAMSID